jgi:hypothetical protein
MDIVAVKKRRVSYSLVETDTNRRAEKIAERIGGSYIRKRCVPACHYRFGVFPAIILDKRIHLLVFVFTSFVS